jgi:ATP-dependent helicase/nuclease subunit A
MTRARDRLVLIGSMKGAADLISGGSPACAAADVDVQGAKTFLDMLLPLTGESGIDLSVVSLSGLVRSVEEGESGSGLAAERLAELDGEEPDGDISAEIDRRLSFSYPHPSAVRLKSKYSVSELNRKAAKAPRTHYYIEETEDATAEDEGATRDDAERADKGEAAMRGTALHKALERLDYAAARDAHADAAWFDAYLDDLVKGGFLTPEQRALVRTGDLMSFASSDICSRAASSPNARREAPFNYRMTMDGEKVIVQGVIDMFFEEDGDLVLVDFKSGGASQDEAGRASHAIGTYGEQLRLYREALEAITGKRVKEALLYLTAYGQTVPVPAAGDRQRTDTSS